MVFGRDLYLLWDRMSFDPPCRNHDFQRDARYIDDAERFFTLEDDHGRVDPIITVTVFLHTYTFSILSP